MPLPLEPRSKWGLTQAALDALLAALDPDREAAGQKYEALRYRLIKYFEWRSCAGAEAHADTTLNRVARNLEAGETIREVPSYCLGVARLVQLEVGRAAARERAALQEMPPPAREPERSVDEMHCFNECLAALNEATRNMIVEYYRDDRRAKIDRRKEIAVTLGIPLNALRIRAHRVRASLETCISACLRRVKV